MLIEAPRFTDRFGAVKIHDLIRVLELDSGIKSEEEKWTPLTVSIPTSKIESIQDDMVVVIPAKNERLKLLEGVLSGIPHDCRIVLVSNSRIRGINRYRLEVDVVEQFHRVTGHPIMIVHQKDPGLGRAFREAGYNHILDSDGLVRDGKGEGMLVGVAIARSLGAEYVCFVDSDNYIPGAVNEYIKDYAACFHISRSKYTMVRIAWRYKPKIVESSIYFRKWGRVSEVTNKYLNLLLASRTGFETGVIKTGNAGEHAMTMELAEIMEFSTGYSVEPYQFIYLFEQFGGIRSTEYPDVVEQGVEIFQIESMNPHLHEDKGEDHIKEMLLLSLATIYHSELCDDDLRIKIKEELVRLEILREDEEIPRPTRMPPIRSMDQDVFSNVLKENSQTMRLYGVEI